MKKIEKLTKAQLDKIPHYVDEFIRRGLTTKQRTLEEATRDFTDFQRVILGKDPAPVVLLKSPSECWKAVVEESVKGATSKAEEKKIREELKNFLYPYFDCQFWASYFGFYEYFRKECGIDYKNEAYDVLLRCFEYGMVFPLDTLCIVCQPFSEIHRNAAGALHNEKGPALSYGGDNEIYALNGVVMKKEQVMTPAEQMNPTDIFRETNVEVRRELIRKVGIERMLAVLPNRLLDKVGNYELFSIDLSDEVKDARYLKMTNPSIGCFHMEGVDPSIKTVEAALKWRNNNWFTNADILT